MKLGVEKSRVEMSFKLIVRGRLNPGFFNSRLEVEKSWVEKFGVEKFMVEKSGVEKSGVVKFMVEKSRVERSGVEAWG